MSCKKQKAKRRILPEDLAEQKILDGSHPLNTTVPENTCFPAESLTVSSNDGQGLPAGVSYANTAARILGQPGEPVPTASELREKTARWAQQHNERIAPPTLQIAIVGKAPSSCMAAPYDDPTWEIWGLSDLFKQVPRWNRYFEIHDPYSRKDKWAKIGYWDFLSAEHRDSAGNLKPIYMQRHYDEFPCSVPYPKDSIVEQFGTYFTNSVSFMIALAMREGVTDLALFGVDMAQQAVQVKSEYAHQRPSCEYMLGVATGLGIRVAVHVKSDLLKCWKLYGFDSDPDALQIKMMARKQELQQQMDQIQKEINEKTLRQHVLAGALDDMSWHEEWINSSPERRLELLGPLKQLLKQGAA